MVSFDKKVNEDNEKQDVLNIQGLDILFILKNYPTEILNKYLDDNLMTFLRKVEKKINNSTGEGKMLLLGKSYQLDIATCGQFKEFIDLLIEQEVLYERKTLLAIPEENYEGEIESLEKQLKGNINYHQINPNFEYQLYSFKFAKYIKGLIENFNYITGVIESGFANKKKALSELKRIKTKLQTMGYEIMDSSNQDDFSEGMPKKVLFFSDIMDTIDCGNEEDYEALAQKLRLLKDKNNADKIVFSLITGDESEQYLLHYFDKITPILEQYGIEIGRQFMSDKYYNPVEKEFIWYSKNSKIDKIIDCANELKEENELVSVYYVDDNPTYYDGEIQATLGDTYYCCLGIGNQENANRENFTGTTESNIQGVLEVIDFHLEPEKIDEIKSLRLVKQQEKNYGDGDDLPF